jgi:hypothetical protein
MASAAEIIHEIETSYTAYNDAFLREDIPGVVRYITAPYVMNIGGNPPRISQTPEDVLANFNASLAGMKKGGWKRSDTKIVKIWPFSDNHALLMADIVRHKTDGSILNKGRYCYSMRRAGDIWQICAVTDVADAFAGPGAGDIPRLYKA